MPAGMRWQTDPNECHSITGTSQSLSFATPAKVVLLYYLNFAAREKEGGREGERNSNLTTSERERETRIRKLHFTRIVV